MRVENKVFLLLGFLWILFLSIVYVGACHYLLASLLNLEDGSQEILINHYAFNQTIKQYLIVFIFIGLLFGGLAGYLLRAVSVYYSHTLKQLHHVMAEQVNKMDELHKKLSLLEQRAEKAEKVEGMFHTVYDLLNSMGTSLSLSQEKIENSNVNKLTDLVMLLAQHQDNVGAFIMNDAQGQQVPSYLAVISKAWVEENAFLIKELTLLVTCFNKMNRVIHAIQS